MTAMRGGIDLGGTKIQAAVVDGDGQVHGQSRLPTPTEGEPADVAAAMADAMREAAADADVETADLDGVGVGSPGVVDDAAGTVAGAGNLPHWDAPFALRDALSEALGCPVRLGNDVQVATDAEVALGAGRPYGSLLGVFWGTGVGGGIVLDGKPWLGRAAAGEIGHVVVKIGGRRCPAGARAAWRPTPAAARWSGVRASGWRRARRRSCSRSWRSAGASGCPAACGRER